MERNRVVPKYYYVGNRKLHILHTRLRTKCSSLNHELFLKHITESPLCHCGAVETTEHILMACHLYTASAQTLLMWFLSNLQSHFRFFYMAIICYHYIPILLSLKLFRNISKTLNVLHNIEFRTK